MSCERRFRVTDEATEAPWSVSAWPVIVYLADCERGAAPGDSKGTRDMIMSDMNTTIHTTPDSWYTARLMKTAPLLDDTIETCLAKGLIEVVKDMVEPSVNK
jgi:hypothetical protein